MGSPTRNPRSPSESALKTPIAFTLFVFSFITFRSCKHLDGKHSIFGRIGGGAETILTAIENVETDNKDRPIEDIVIQKATVFVDPFTEADEEVRI